MLEIKTSGIENAIRKTMAKINNKVDELMPLVEYGDYWSFEVALDEIRKDEESFFFEHEICRKALNRSVEAGDVAAVEFLVKKCNYVNILKDISLDKTGNWLVPTNEDLDEWDLEEITSPFITDDMEMMEILLSQDYDRTASRVMWTDFTNVYYGEMTPLAAAIASGNREMIGLLTEKEGGLKGFFYDNDDIWCTTTKKRHITDWRVNNIREEVLGGGSGRLWSPEEAMIMGSGNDISMLDMLFEKDRWYGMGDVAVEIDGEMVYENVHNHAIPDAVYWMTEEASIALEHKYPEMRIKYDIQKILNAGNNVMLATYLAEHRNINPEVIEAMIGQLTNPTIRMMTVDMLDEQAGLSDVHTVPFDMTYYSDKRECCITTLEAYKEGKRGMMYLTGDIYDYENVQDLLGDDVTGMIVFDPAEWDLDEDPEDETPGWDGWDDEPEYEKLPDADEEDPFEDWGKGYDDEEDDEWAEFR